MGFRLQLLPSALLWELNGGRGTQKCEELVVLVKKETSTCCDLKCAINQLHYCIEHSISDTRFQRHVFFFFQTKVH